MCVFLASLLVKWMVAVARGSVSTGRSDCIAGLSRRPSYRDAQDRSCCRRRTDDELRLSWRCGWQSDRGILYRASSGRFVVRHGGGRFRSSVGEILEGTQALSGQLV